MFHIDIEGKCGWIIGEPKAMLPQSKIIGGGGGGAGLPLPPLPTPMPYTNNIITIMTPYLFQSGAIEVPFCQGHKHS